MLLFFWSYQLIRSLHTQISSFTEGLRSAYDIGHKGAREECGRHAGGAPGETLGLAHDVLLFAAVTGTDQGDRGSDLVKLLQDLLEG